MKTGTHTQVPVPMTKLRHHLVHGYYQVDSRIVWDVIQHDLNPLHEQIKKLLSETDWEQWEKK